VISTCHSTASRSRARVPEVGTDSRVAEKAQHRAVVSTRVIFAVIFVTVWQLHRLCSSAKVSSRAATPVRTSRCRVSAIHGQPFNLTPWYPGWFAGMPAYTYYFVLPDLLATLGSYVITFAVAMKLATILGSVLMPITAYMMDDCSRAASDSGRALDRDVTFSSMRPSRSMRNLFSTMAGIAFSLSLALALLTIGSSHAVSVPDGATGSPR